LRGLAKFVEVGLVAKTGGNADEALTYKMFEQRGGPGGGSVSLLRPDGSPFPGSPFVGGSLPGPWAVDVDGDDNVWISNFAGASGQIAHLCGVRTENCPSGMKTGDQISPPLGYVGGGLQMQTDLAIGPSGDVWVMDNWEDIDACFGRAPGLFRPIAAGRASRSSTAWPSRSTPRRLGLRAAFSAMT
jgi:hypothetical protein